MTYHTFHWCFPIYFCLPAALARHYYNKEIHIRPEERLWTSLKAIISKQFKWEKEKHKGKKHMDCNLADTHGLLGIHSASFRVSRHGTCPLEDTWPSGTFYN